MNEANVGITISDPDTEDNPLVYVNDGFVDQTGYDRGEAVGRNCRFLQADDRDQSALDDLRAAIQAEEPTTVELRNYRKDGEQFWNRLSVTPVYGEDDGLVNYIGIQQDVTDKKRRERRLEALHGTTRDLLQTDSIDEATAAAVETLTDQFEFEMASVYLRDGDELVRTASTERLPTDTTERFHRGESPLWEAIDDGETVHYEDYTDVDDGVDRGDVAASTYLPVGDHGALVVGVTDSERLGESERRLVEVLCGNLAAVLDSLEREASLRASERRYRSLAENIPNGAVLTFDEHLTYGLAAGELLSAFGLAESDISGKEVGTVLGDGDHELVSRFRAALDGERTDSRIDLQDRTIRIHIVPVDPGEDAEMYGLALAQDVTDEARRERELFEERERFRLLTESVDEYAFVTVGEDGTIETWPAGAENLFGYDAETAVGMSMAELHPEADRETDVPGRLLRQARIAGESADEGWRVREDGSEFYADVRYAPLETDDGEFQGYAKVIRDMTDRRRERRRTERFVEESDDVVTIVDTDGEITYASGSATRVLGYDPGDLVGENLFDYLHPDGRQHAMETFYECIGEGVNVKAECRLKSPEGGWKNVEGRCRNMLDEEAIDGILIYLRDVTETKERSRRFESIFNGTFQFTGLLEPDGTVVEANEAALAFSGVDRDAIVGERFYDTPWWSHSETVQDNVQDAIERAADGEFVRYETEARGADGLATIDFSVKPVTNEDGDVSLLVVEGRDITTRQQHRRHLEVMQRVMRHNMRNDLSKIRGWTEMMAEESDPDTRAQQFETLDGIFDKWEGMIERMKQIRQVLESQGTEGARTAAGDLLEDAVTPVREAHDDLTVLTDVSDAASVPVPATVREAVRELAQNAANAPEASVVEVGLTHPEDEWLEIGVRDDGAGIPEMEADVLETGEETPLNHGEGLGLWMVRMIVTQAGGEVSVESTADGTAVCLRLPVERSVTPAVR
jgi:PAS domain S-box-containing protein